MSRAHVQCCVAADAGGELELMRQHAIALRIAQVGARRKRILVVFAETVADMRVGFRTRCGLRVRFGDQRRRGAHQRRQRWRPTR